MSGPYAYTPYIWPSFFTLVFLIALSVYGWRRRNVPGALLFAVGGLFAALWAAGTVMEYAAVDIALKVFWAKFQGIWHLPAATAITCFVLEYAWPGRWLTRRNLALLSIAPLLALGLALTDDLYHLLWRGFAYDGRVILLRTPVNYWMFFPYGYGLGIVNLIVLAWLFLRSPQHRWPVAIMLTGLIGGRGLFLLEAAQAIRTALPLDIPPISFEYLMYAVALFGFRLFDPIPLAHQTVIAQMREGMLALDPQGRVVSLNPVAQAILGVPAKRARGRPIQDLLPAYADLVRDLEAVGVGQTEVRLGIRPDTRYYELEASLLKDWRGLAIGCLLLLHDVTEEKRAQAQLMEQQRALATLQERERLARELHDSIGQVLGYVSFQVEAARKLLDDGQIAVANMQLARLAGIAQDAHADVREYILDLRTGPSAQQPFFSALRHYLDGFTRNYDIQAELVLGAGWDADIFEPGAQAQLFRVIQEALSNARKHANARRVQVRFETEDSRARIIIQDDGRGFPTPPARGDGRQFGLQFMRERAEQVGGRLQIRSAPGQGTQVVVEVPVTNRGK